MADENKDQKAFSLKDDPSFKQLVAVVSAMGAGIKGMENTVNSLKQAVEQKGGNNGKQQDQEEEETIDEETINEMKPADLMKMLTKVVTDTVQKQVDGVRKEVSSFRDDVTAKGTRAEIDAFAKENPALMHFVDEMKEIINEMPGISIKRAYALARSENPDKAKQVDAELAKESGKDPDAKPKLPFGGLTPTSGTNVGDDGKPVQMTPQDAADKAWEETLSQFPLLANND